MAIRGNRPPPCPGGVCRPVNRPTIERPGFDRPAVLRPVVQRPLARRPGGVAPAAPVATLDGEPEFDMVPVDSSNLAAVGYNSEHRVLRVRFTSGATYDYANVPAVQVYNLMQAESHGSYHYHYIRSIYPYRRLAGT